MVEIPFALCPLPSANKPKGRHNDSDGGVSPSKNVSPEILFPFILPFYKRSLGRHSDVEGGVRPSGNPRCNHLDDLTYNFHLPSI